MTDLNEVSNSINGSIENSLRSTIFQSLWHSIYRESDIVPKYMKYIRFGAGFLLTQHGCSDNLFGTLVLITAVCLYRGIWRRK